MKVCIPDSPFLKVKNANKSYFLENHKHWNSAALPISLWVFPQMINPPILITNINR